ncbi:MAG: cysteine desulfurase [Nitrospirae bacterium]|nr:cysteine desulfurase [Nitrospirota bacterium]
MKHKKISPSNPVYLDNNASTPLAPKVAGVMLACLKSNFGNPSSAHSYGKDSREAVEHARKQVAGLINARPEEIIFTSGGTEANNLAILGTALRSGPGHIISSCIEHPSVTNPLKYLEETGYKVTFLPVDKYGIVGPDILKKHIRRDTILITIMHSNNETGSIQPIAEIGDIARSKGIVFHCDAAQSAGKVPVNVTKLNVDLLTIVSHKFYGPKGVGALYMKRGVELKPILYGASHEKGLRPGTENVCSIAGLGKAAELAKKQMRTRVSGMRDLSHIFHDELLKEIPGIKLNGHPAKRLPNTLNLSFPDIQGHVLLEKLKHEIAASTGSACHEGKHKPSSVLKAMGLTDKEALSAVRLSLGINNTEAQIRRAVKAIVKAYRNL